MAFNALGDKGALDLSDNRIGKEVQRVLAERFETPMQGKVYRPWLGAPSHP